MPLRLHPHPCVFGRPNGRSAHLRGWVCPILGLALALTGLRAHAAAPSPDTPLSERQDRTWSASCAACHPASATAPASRIPPLAGRDAESTYRTLLAFKQGQRPDATVMPQLVRGYTDEELLRIARHLGRQPTR